MEAKRAADPKRRAYKTKQKKAAHAAVLTALRAGDLQRPAACEYCGAEPGVLGALDAHHEDYNLPVDVIWLCRPCHVSRHQEIASTGVAA